MKMRFELPNIEIWNLNGPFANSPHNHDRTFQFTLPMSGAFSFQQENRTYRLSEGQGLVQSPRDMHDFRIDESDNSRNRSA